MCKIVVCVVERERAGTRSKTKTYINWEQNDICSSRRTLTTTTSILPIAHLLVGRSLVRPVLLLFPLLPTGKYDVVLPNPTTNSFERASERSSESAIVDRGSWIVDRVVSSRKCCGRLFSLSLSLC